MVLRSSYCCPAEYEVAGVVDVGAMESQNVASFYRRSHRRRLWVGGGSYQLGKLERCVVELVIVGSCVVADWTWIANECESVEYGCYLMQKRLWISGCYSNYMLLS